MEESKSAEELLIEKPLRECSAQELANHDEKVLARKVESAQKKMIRANRMLEKYYALKAQMDVGTLEATKLAAFYDAGSGLQEMKRREDLKKNNA